MMAVADNWPATAVIPDAMYPDRPRAAESALLLRQVAMNGVHLQSSTHVKALRLQIEPFTLQIQVYAISHLINNPVAARGWPWYGTQYVRTCASFGYAYVTMLLSTPPDREIAVPLADLVSALQLLLPDDHLEALNETTGLLTNFIDHQFRLLQRQLIRRFYFFGLSASKGYIHSGSRQHPELINDQGYIFVDHFVSLLLAARFMPLTQQQQEVAEHDSFKIDTPVRIQWNELDSTLLKTFWSSSAARQELRQHLPPSADRVIVFHRGMGLASATGVYWQKKLDLLVR